MNDRPTPLTDEDLSAAIDGEASDDVLARLAADPAAQVRRDQLLAARDLLAGSTTPTLAAAQVDALVGHAIDGTSAVPAPVRGRRGPAPWLVAAALALLVALGLTLVWVGRGASDEVATSADSAESSGGGASDEDAFDAIGGHAAPEVADGAGSDVAPTTESAAGLQVDPSLVDLGTFEQPEDLRSALATSFPPFEGLDDGATERAVPRAAAVDRCAEQLQVALDLDEDQLGQAGFATVDGREVLVYEWSTESFQDGTETTLVTAVGADACDEVVLFER